MVSNEIPRIHKFIMPCHSEPFDCRSRQASEESLNNEISQSLSSFRNDTRIIKTVSLTSASGSANRAIGSMPLYRQLKNKNPEFNTFDFRVMQYREFF